MATKAQLRRKTIINLLSQIPISSTQQLAEAAEVSTETMRKDLDILAEEGLIIKVHGGVALAKASPNEIPFEERAKTNIEEKRRIAGAALSLINENDSLIFESCTTNLELARALLLKPDLLQSLVIITNSFSICTVLDGGKKCRKLFFLGGWINPSQYASHGYQTAKMIEDFHVNKAFISGAALSNEFILSAYYDDDAIFQKTAINAAKETVLMIDSSKFSKNAVLSVAPLNRITYIVTDKKLESADENQITSGGTRIIIV